MGQYYKVALVDSEWSIKVIQPDGYKLLEHAYYNSRTMRRIEKLLYRDAKNVMWIWDYAECASFVWKHKFEDEEEINYERNLTEEDVLVKNPDDDYFLVNKSRDEFINMTRQEMKNDKEWTKWNWIHPLPILCRANWEFWWGDYRPHMLNWEHMWNWCGDIISVIHWKRDEIEKSLKDNQFDDMTDIYFFKE